MAKIDFDHLIHPLLKATEHTAIIAAEYTGTGKDMKVAADKAAIDTLRKELNRIEFLAKTILCEGEKDNSHFFIHGELHGKNINGSKPLSLVCDAIEGTTSTVNLSENAMSVLGIAEPDSLFHTDCHYMQKLAYGPDIAQKVPLSIQDTPHTLVEKVAYATKKDPRNIVFCLLDQPRHTETIALLRKEGIRIKLIENCDVPAVLGCYLGNIDVYMGIGGTSEGVLSAMCMKCLRGDFQGIAVDKNLAPQSEALQINQLVKGECAFFATGITNGDILRGVKHNNDRPITHSIVMQSVGRTMQFVETHHWI